MNITRADELIWQAVERRYFTDSKLSPSPAFQNSTPAGHRNSNPAADLHSLRADLSKTLNIQTQLFTQYQLGSVPDQMYQATNRNIQDRINELSALIVKAEQGRDAEVLQQQQREWLERFTGIDRRTLALNEQRELLAGLIERITVRFLPGQNTHELQIVFRFSAENAGGNLTENLRLPVKEA
jgi:hypothetical protein